MTKKLSARLVAVLADKRGVTAMEYGLIAAFIAVAIIGGLTLLGGNLNSMLNGIAANFAAPA
ncbi:Flp family type IVb pilin [Neoroseomonas oryzicola]|uniref:Flp family type IVb pilin n=1 Tax=Neoroseomonas oryzicola TaxID=535904 RepID=A0A9X9WJE6_9PROT|nr:Flp family type IVb pilin [Neoroseomonas oryzicola]MBR0660456.1 Flp family type IVb pilin [Neoroseomonas oryzicola]NKE17406.1 Flp family type IVb pilin [Neoroseomonas oryzicola]